jgi:hypothetical protein
MKMIIRSFLKEQSIEVPSKINHPRTSHAYLNDLAFIRQTKMNKSNIFAGLVLNKICITSQYVYHKNIKGSQKTVLLDTQTMIKISSPKTFVSGSSPPACKMSDAQLRKCIKCTKYKCIILINSLHSEKTLVGTGNTFERSA